METFLHFIPYIVTAIILLWIVAVAYFYYELFIKNKPKNNEFEITRDRNIL